MPSTTRDRTLKYKAMARLFFFFFLNHKKFDKNLGREMLRSCLTRVTIPSPSAVPFWIISQGSTWKEHGSGGKKIWTAGILSSILGHSGVRVNPGNIGQK